MSEERKYAKVLYMNIAIVLAAGKSERLNEINIPKQLYVINQVPLFMYSVLTFESLEEIDEIYLVTNEECLPIIEQYLKQFTIKKIKGVLMGGETRQESVYQALKHLKTNAKNDDIVLIHDAARPLIEKNTILENIKSAKKYDAVTTAIKVKDSLFDGSDELVGNVVDRSHLYQAQTPQSFRYSLIKRAHEFALENGIQATDDSALVKKLGYNIHIVNGTTTNFKVTTIDDIRLLEMMVNKN